MCQKLPDYHATGRIRRLVEIRVLLNSKKRLSVRRREQSVMVGQSLIYSDFVHLFLKNQVLMNYQQYSIIIYLLLFDNFDLTKMVPVVACEVSIYTSNF
jgi:hypothetical protein